MMAGNLNAADLFFKCNVPQLCFGILYAVTAAADPKSRRILQKKSTRTRARNKKR